MKSGLEDRNNTYLALSGVRWLHVSMKSGLEDRNNKGFFGLSAV